MAVAVESFRNTEISPKPSLVDRIIPFAHIANKTFLAFIAPIITRLTDASPSLAQNGQPVQAEVVGISTRRETRARTEYREPWDGKIGGRDAVEVSNEIDRSLNQMINERFNPKTPNP